MSIVSASSTPHVLDMLPATGVRITIDHPTRNVQLDQLSTIVHDCVQTLVSALHSRASLLANCGQLNDAMSDAAATMSIAPTSPFGYLCAGRIFSYRGQHASAIKIYDDGLQHVPRLHDQYAQLLSAKAVSQQKINTRIDFFSWLPLEIVLSNLIPRIFDGQTVVDIGKEGRYLDVSRTWRERIAMADGFTFRVGTFPRSSSKGLSAKEYDQLLDMAPYIKSFAVWGLHEGIADHLTGGTTFTALKKLHVDGVHSRPLIRLLPLLNALGASMTQLTMDYGYSCTSETPYRLCDYLEACPNLAALSISNGGFDTSFVFSQYPKLKKLDLSNANVSMDEDTMYAFLRPLPQLRLLSIIPTPSSSILPAIQQACPLLQQLVFSNTLPRFLPDIGDIQDDDSGLRVLAVRDPGKRKRFRGDDMMRYVVEHSDTIESIDIGAGFEFSSSLLLQEEMNIEMTFMRLRQISYPSHVDECYIPLIVWLLQHAPQLRSVDTIYGDLQAPVFQELMNPNHQHFTRIGLKADGSSQENEKRFIQHHISCGHQSNVEVIHIEVVKHSLSDSWILLITQLTQLRQLEVCCKGSSVMGDVLVPFISKIASGCPALERFTWMSPESPVDYKIISIISCHTNLKTLIINSTHLSGDPSSLPSFIQRLQRLQEFHLDLYLLDAEIYAIFKSSTFEFVYTQRTRHHH